MIREIKFSLADIKLGIFHVWYIDSDKNSGFTLRPFHRWEEFSNMRVCILFRVLELTYCPS